MFNIDQSYTSLDYKPNTNTPKLDAETEKRLLVLAQGGDKEALERLVNTYMGMIFYNIQRMFPNASKEEQEDMVQDGMALLVESIYKFDVNGKARFSTYFYMTITRGLPMMYWRSSLSTLTFGTWSKRHRITKQMDRYGLSWEEVEDELGIQEGTAESWTARFSEAIRPDEEGYFDSFVDKEDPESIYLDTEEERLLSNAISSLSEREQFIINHLYGLNGCDRLMAKEVASELGISEPYMWNLRRRAINKIRSILTAQ